MIFNIKGVKILFIHIPKTGGTSIEKFFLETMGLDMFIDNKYREDFLWGLRDGVFLQHLTMDEIFNKYKFLNINEIDFIFTIVREPVSRFKSYSKWINRDKNSIEHFKTKSETSHIKPQTSFVHGFYDKIKIYKYEYGLQNIINDVLNIVNATSNAKLSHTMNRKKIKITFDHNQTDLIQRFYKIDFINFLYLLN